MLSSISLAPPTVGGVATAPDLLRLVAVPALGWAAWRDHRTRRVPGRLWWPLAVLGVALLGWEALGVMAGTGTSVTIFLLRVGISVGLLVPVALGFYRFNLLGGADAKAFVVLAVLLPTYPLYDLGVLVLPAVRPPLGVFSVTVITNGAILSLLYPLALVAGNLADGARSAAIFRARRVHWTEIPETHGRLAETPESRTMSGLDLDALRMYLRWRRVSFQDLRERADALRDPATVPDDPGDPTDGRLDPAERIAASEEHEAEGSADGTADWSYADPWAAEEFLTAVGSAYGTTPDQLRQGLELLKARDEVWVSPGLPYLVPVFIGLVVGLSYGDVLFALLGLVGLG